MSYRNIHKKNYSERDRSYWTSRFSSLPPELNIPGEKKREPESPVSARISALEKFALPGNLIRALTTFAARRSTTLFIILQASLKFYIFKSTGQNDIVIGTQVVGREDLEQIEDQIGFYTKMNLLRTILDENDSFEDCVAKVIRSNEDMYTYTAFSLMDYLEKMLPPNEHITGKFWKITMQYYDSKGFSNYELEVPATQESIPVTSILNLNKQIIENIDLKLEFFNEGNVLKVHIIYDQSLYERETILDFIEKYYQFLKHIFKIPPEA